MNGLKEDISEIKNISYNSIKINWKAYELYAIFKNCVNFYTGISHPIKTDKHRYAFYELAPIAPYIHIWVHYIDGDEIEEAPLLRLPIEFLNKDKNELIDIRNQYTITDCITKLKE